MISKIEVTDTQSLTKISSAQVLMAIAIVIVGLLALAYYVA